MFPPRLRSPFRWTLKEPSLLMARSSAPVYFWVSPGSKAGGAELGEVVILRAYPKDKLKKDKLKDFLLALPAAGGSFLAEVGRLARRPGEGEDVHTGIGTVDGVDIAAVVHFHVVGLNGDLAVLVGSLAHAAFIGLVGHGRDVVSDFLGVELIANVDASHAGVEVRDEQHAVVIDRREALVRRMRTEASA